MVSAVCFYTAAGLNLGDCFTDALAQRSGYVILCVGDDFPRTDLGVVQPPH
jgi:ribonuclease VapC